MIMELRIDIIVNSMLYGAKLKIPAVISQGDHQK